MTANKQEVTALVEKENVITNWRSTTNEFRHTGLGELVFNPIAPRKAKIVYAFGLSGCNRVKRVQNIQHPTIYDLYK